jgi:hypothetical protein
MTAYTVARPTLEWADYGLAESVADLPDEE